MKILIVGATGTIGKALVTGIGSDHDLIKVGRRSGDYRANISDADSLRLLFATVGQVDAIVSAAGEAHFGPLLETGESLR